MGALVALIAVSSLVVAWQMLGGDILPAREDGRDWRLAACRLPHRWVELAERGWHRSKAGRSDLILFRDPPANHSGPHDVLQSVPLVFYGPGLVPPGEVRLRREVTLADVAATTAEMIGLEGMEFPDGRVIKEVLPREGRPALVVTVVMDGGGWNTLELWSDKHPNIDRLISEGASVTDVKVGSSPSITTAVHATLSTGAFPNEHAVTGLFQRNDEGKVVPAFSLKGISLQHRAHPGNLKLPTVADEWDLQNDNQAQIGYVASFNYPLGMVGHGSAHPGGDKDIVAIGAKGQWKTARESYSLPKYIRDLPGMESEIEELDRSDGKADGAWLGSEAAFTRLDALPIFPPWQNRAVFAMLEHEGFGRDDVTDMLYINHKPMDLSAHFWDLDSEPTEAAVGAVDQAVGDLAAWLDEQLPERYVLILTADHGGIPLQSNAFPYQAETVTEGVQDTLDEVDNDIGIFEKLTPTVYFVNEEELERNRLTPEDLADHLQAFKISDGLPPDGEVSSEFEGDIEDPLFKAVVPASRLDEILRCTGGTDRASSPRPG